MGNMTDDTLRKLDELFAESVDDVDDPGTQYKLRSARQLVRVVEQHHQVDTETTETYVPDETADTKSS